MQLLCIRNTKWSKSVALVRLLTVSMAYILVLGTASPLLVAETEKNLDNDSHPSIVPSLNTTTLKEKETVENLGSGFNSTPGCHDDLCLTPACIHTASTILKNMDPTVDPCENFYRYACGGFLKSTVIPDDKSSISLFSTAADKIEEQLRTSLEAKSSPDEPKPYRLFKNLYKSCMNTTAIEARGLQPLHDVLRKLGGWPVLDGNSWNETDFDWRSSIYKFRNIGFDYDSLISVTIDQDLKNTTKRLIQLSQPNLRIFRKSSLNGFIDQALVPYYDYMVDIAVMLGAPRDRAVAELKETIRFEIQLANISLPKEALNNMTKLYNPMTLQELTAKYSSVPWKEFYTNIFPSSVVIEDNEITNVLVPSYIAAFEKLISQTPKRVQANYVLWDVVEDSVRYLNKKIRERQLAYHKTSIGLTERPARWKECLDVSKDLPLHATYARQYFSEDAKKNALHMIMSIREQLQDMMQKADWMDENTRKKAIEKLRAMASFIGYPDELLNDDNLKKHYENLELSEDNYYENFLRRSRFGVDVAFSKFREPVNRKDWQNHAETATVNAFYNPYENSIILPAGILQGSFFNNDRPKYMNYGAIGTIIGHEITHAFDSKGSQFDKNGDLFDWWEPSTKETYLNRTSCIVNQYSNYTVEEIQLKIRGIITEGENTADLGGLRAAYYAYNKWAAKNGPEKKLPGINRTPQQMFWISNANVWCKKDTTQFLEFRIHKDPHSTEEFRIVGPMSNMPEFSRDFHCPLGSKMNPVKKCNVW